jgi:hypothetical protein
LSISFGRMRLQWSTIPRDIRKNLEQSLLEKGNDFSIGELSDFLEESLQMNCRWNANENIRKMVYNGIKRWFGDKNNILVDKKGLCDIIYGFGEVNTKWVHIPKEIRECVYNGIEKHSSHFNSHDISNILYE